MEILVRYEKAGVVGMVDNGAHLIVSQVPRKHYVAFHLPNILFLFDLPNIVLYFSWQIHSYIWLYIQSHINQL